MIEHFSFLRIEIYICIYICIYVYIILIYWPTYLVTVRFTIHCLDLGPIGFFFNIVVSLSFIEL